MANPTSLVESNFSVNALAKGVRVSTARLAYYVELAWRSYRRNPWLTLSVVLTLAIGIGTSMTALALLHILSADPIPGKSASLFQPRRVYADATHGTHTMIDFQEARALLGAAPHASSDAILAESFGSVSTTKSQMSPQSTMALHTTRSFFKLFDVPFLLGANWSENSENAGEHVGVISKPLAIRLFGRTSVVGESLRYGGTLFRIVGVLDDWRQIPRVYNLQAGGEYMKADDIFTPISSCAVVSGIGNLSMKKLRVLRASARNSNMMVTLRRRFEPRTTELTTFDDIREIAHALSGVVDGTSYGTPALKVGGKLIAPPSEHGLRCTS
jgi:hypothetical protein